MVSSSAASRGAPPPSSTPTSRAKRAASAYWRSVFTSGSASSDVESVRRPSSVLRVHAASAAIASGTRKSTGQKRCKPVETESSMPRGRRQRRAAPGEQRDEARQHEEEQYRDGDRARAREQERIDRRRDDATAKRLVALELVGETRERAVHVAAALTGAHQADVERREERRVCRERRGKRLAVLDACAHLRERVANLAAGDAGRGVERLRQRHPDGKKRRHRARDLEHLAPPPELETVAPGSGPARFGDLEHQQSALLERPRERAGARGVLESPQPLAGAVDGLICEGRHVRAPGAAAYFQLRMSAFSPSPPGTPSAPYERRS